MPQMVSTPQELPPAYQIVVTSGEDSTPPPNYSADLPDPKKAKPYKPKNLSKLLFLDLKLAASAALYLVNWQPFTTGALIGLAKPLFDWKYRNVIPKKLEVETNEGDFSRMNYENKLSYAVIGVFGPVIVASALTSSYPSFSMGIVGWGGYTLAQELTQRWIRWTNRPS